MPTRFLHTADWQLGKPYERIDNDDDKRSLASQARFDVLKTIGRATGSGRTHPQPEPKTASFRSVLVQHAKGTA